MDVLIAGTSATFLWSLLAWMFTRNRISAAAPAPALLAADPLQEIREFLRDYKVNYERPHMQPRGLTNRSLWCYSHSVMQALISIPQFVNLFMKMDDVLGELVSSETMPISVCIIFFINSYTCIDGDNSSPSEGTDDGESTTYETIRRVDPIRAVSIYHLLTKLSVDFPAGMQHDAEEMLSFLLNSTQEEFIKQNFMEAIADSDDDGTSHGGISENKNEYDEVTENTANQNTKPGFTQFSPTPISKIFWGTTHFIIKTDEAVLVEKFEPFITLPLVIQDEKIASLEDALKHYVTLDKMDDNFTHPVTKEIVIASNKRLLHHLPEVLILQLKRFVYTETYETEKIVKHIEFDISLEITEEMVSDGIGKCEYKLVSIVSHTGQTANSGHYICDAFHAGSKCWLRFDDDDVSPIAFEDVKTTVRSNRATYLFFYQRSDTFVDEEFPTEGPSTEIIMEMKKMLKPKKRVAQAPHGIYLPPHLRNRN